MRTAPQDRAARQWSCRLAGLVAFLAALASATGLLVPGVYRDNALIVAAFRGNDLVTLLLAVPLLLGALRSPARDAPRALLVRLGMLVYMLYNYVFYMYGATFNALFLVYVLLVALSILALAFGLADVDPLSVARHFRPRVPARAIAAFLLLFAALLGGMWVAFSLSFVFTGVVPAAITQTGHPTGVVFATDLSLLVPGLVVGAVLLGRRRPWGFVLAPMMTIKASTYGLAMIAMSAFAGLGVDPFLPLWVGLTLGCLVSAGLLLGNLRKEFSDART